MASSPVTPVVSAAVHPIISNWITFVKAHEKLAIIALSAFLVWHIYGRGVDAWVNHDKAQQAIQQQKSDALAQQNAVNSAQVAQLVATVKASNAALVAAAAQRAAATKAQQVADQSLPLPDLGKHWVSLINVSPTDIAAQPDGSMKVSDAASRATVQQLDEIPQLQADVKGAQQIAQNDQDVINKQTVQITGLTNTVAQDKATCDARVKTEHDSGKQKLKTGVKLGSIFTIVLYEGFRIMIGHP